MKYIILIIFFSLFSLCFSEMVEKQSILMKKDGFSDEVFEGQKKDYENFVGFNTDGLSGLLEISCARAAITDEKRSGIGYVSYNKITNPGTTSKYGTIESIDKYSVHPFFSAHFLKYFEGSFSGDFSRQNSSSTLGNAKYTQYDKFRNTKFCAKASGKVNKQGSYLGVESYYDHHKDDDYNTTALGFLFSQELFNNVFLSVNYYNIKYSRTDTITHWQEAGLEAFLSNKSSFVLEARRDTSYSNFRDLELNAGVKMILSRDIIDSQLTVYAKDLNQTYSDGAIGASIAFSF